MIKKKIEFLSLSEFKTILLGKYFSFLFFLEEKLKKKNLRRNKVFENRSNFFIINRIISPPPPKKKYCWKKCQKEIISSPNVFQYKLGYSNVKYKDL